MAGSGEVMMDAPQLMAFMREVFQQVADDFTVEEVKPNEVTMRLNISEKHLRPGGTVSGPSMFALADVAAYIATLAMIGPKALAVTTNCSMDFMRKPVAGVDLIATAKLLKLGRQLSVSHVLIFSEGMDQPVAQATMTYAIPPIKSL
ncbi:PaaI family thioesterase [Sulfitobacter sp. S223]|uniref:PaaI family thioesterase n=1 Tax=Sulfitobacter sp. S223 TaxID=2867023 RepID=UPI0021A7EEE2|nr:PaaI family thioesterase [Sulfitobacter sp. S223]UWR24755.1 PaaI family thioesterase [Sulfitobacter sp. S223]